jgi:hypothetical protein
LLDPHFSTSSNDIRISFNIFDNLTARHPDGKLHPGLATEWKLTAPTTWTFQDPADPLLAIVLETALSFLGLGIQPPTPSWGGMVHEGREYLDSAWWISTAPGGSSCSPRSW